MRGTQKMAKDAALSGKKSTVNMCILHWEDLVSRKKLPDTGEIQGEYCALCYRYGGFATVLLRKTPCPLIGKICPPLPSCCPSWKRALEALLRNDRPGFIGAGEKIISKLKAVYGD